MQTRILCSLLLMAATACYSDRTLGVSKRDKGAEPAPAKSKFPTQIVARPGEAVNFTSPAVGDMDGDGFDDFVLWGQQISENGNFDPNRSLYLFYGRAEFPQQLSTADADAVFSVELSEPSGPAGDINGDGLGDLMLVRMNSVEFVFGSQQRLHGAIAPNSADAVWMAGALPPPFAAGFSTQFLVSRAGDLDGDGCADLIVGATAIVNAAEDGTGGGLIMRPYLIRGHRGEWESAVWNPDWAAAGFGFDAGKLDGSKLFDASMQSLIYPERAGDLDGDGRDDLLAPTAVGSLVFYGRPDYPREVTSSEADARLLASVDGDGQEIAIDAQPWFLGQAWGDLDGDGMDDIAVIDSINSGINFVYGQRWSGEVQLTPQLQVELERPGQQGIQSLATGDLDGDGLPELLLNVIGSGWLGDFTGEQAAEMPRADLGVYVLRGTGERLVGRIKLSQNDRWNGLLRTPGVLPSIPGSQLEIALAGDIDGDRGQDVLTNSLAPNEQGQAEMSMYLIPSTPRSPD